MFKYAAITHPENIVWDIIEVEDKDNISMIEWPDNVLMFIFLNNREDKNSITIGQFYNTETNKFE
jgi:hypothetical protein